MWIYVHICGSQGLIMNVIFDHSHWIRDSPVHPPGQPAHSALGIPDKLTHSPNIYMGSGDLNSDPPKCCVLPSEPSLQPWVTLNLRPETQLCSAFGTNATSCEMPPSVRSPGHLYFNLVTDLLWLTVRPCAEELNMLTPVLWGECLKPSSKTKGRNGTGSGRNDLWLFGGLKRNESWGGGEDDKDSSSRLSKQSVK